jgi:hypothetical protein
MDLVKCKVNKYKNLCGFVCLEESIMKQFNLKTAIQCVAFVCVLIILSQVSMAGNLEPNAPPASTMKPLDQVEPRTPITSVPYTISQSGSYYLTKNLTAAGTAITVSADDVTIDLCGFTLTGPGSGSNYGIYMSSRKNIEIRNGTIRSFGYDGIVDNGSGYNHRVIGVQLISNGRNGILLSGNIDLVKDCVVNGNGSSFAGTAYGIYVPPNSTVVGCTVYNNGNSAAGSAYGISALAGSKITGNTVYANGNSAAGNVYGIAASTSSTITGNTVYANGLAGGGAVYGIYADMGSTITGNTVGGNGSASDYGIYANTGSTITGNTVYSNVGDGIVSTTYCQIVENCVTGNAARGIVAGNNSNISGNVVGSNTSDGISAGDHVTITGNTVSSNGGTGIACTGGYIARNTVSLNNTSATVGLGGIVLSYRSQVKENTLEGNSKNNIYILQYRNSIEGNVMSGSDTGINFGSNGNYFNNNRATANSTNYANIGTNTDGGGNVSF